MKLQVAIDLLSTADALSLLAKVAENIDVIEIGTPLVKIDGLKVLTAVKAAHPSKAVFADLKTMDAGELEADLAFKAGADFVSVLALAGDPTIAGAVRAATAHGKKIVADLIGVPAGLRLDRIKELKALGVAHVEVHAGLDEQATPGYRIEDLLESVRGSVLPVAVAGGINSATIDQVRDSGAAYAVVGGGIYGAKDPAAASRALKDAANQAKAA
jgi:3-hexulose-6-phosphate synthase